MPNFRFTLAPGQQEALTITDEDKMLARATWQQRLKDHPLRDILDAKETPPRGQ